ncbi:MAG: hypothetical protein JJ974_08900 [Phycisphaerales bacterium]|nr:hypothetical protein [Phycisphaerales bacterium]
MKTESKNLDESVRIAMWSGPRNISTAMMRSWGARGDCVVSDEPLYGHYLSTLDAEKRREHPVCDDVMTSQGTDCRRVIEELTGEVPGGKRVWYQKHMAHHLTEDCGMEWLGSLTNCVLIRDPAAMITSFIKVIDDPTPEDLGLPQLLRIVEWVARETREFPVVIDSRDVLMDPAGMLRKLCERVGVGFDESMLSWEAGARETDGVWGPHWYSGVYASTGFRGYVAKDERVPERLLGVLDQCQSMYEQLSVHKI